MRSKSIPLFCTTALAMVAAWSAAGCGDTPRAGATPIGTGDGGGGSGGTDAGAVDTQPPADGAAGSDGAVTPPPLAAPSPVGLAVVGSDFASTSISLVASAGTLMRDDCINSGTGAGGGLSATLSGDVTLPSQPQRGNDLWLIDRGNAALTVLDPATCAVRRQMSVGTGFRSNPHDVVVVSDAKAYVPRYERNAATPANPNATGDDLLIVNPVSGAVLGHIDLSAYAVPAAGATIRARPDRAVIAAGKVFVTLGNADAQLAVTTEARLVIVDPASDAVTGTLALTGLTDCSAMDVLPGGALLFVACGGTFGDVDQPLESGVALVDLTVDPPVLLRVISAVALNARPVNFAWVVGLSPNRAFAGTFGAFADPTRGTAATSDAAFVFDPSNGHATQLGLAAAYDLGRAAGDAVHLFVPDATASAPRIHVYDAAAPTPSETAAFDPEPAHGLPPREIAWY